MPCRSIDPSTLNPFIADRPVEPGTAVRVPSPFGWLAIIARMNDRWVQRQCLLDLDDHLLRDIGLTREQVVAEAEKPFWR